MRNNYKNTHTKQALDSKDIIPLKSYKIIVGIYNKGLKINV